METPRSKPVNLGSTQLIHDPTEDLLLEIRLRNELDPELLPQLHHRGNGAIHFTSGNTDGKANFLALLQQRIEKGDLSKIHIKVDESCRTVRIAQHRKKDFLVRARTRAEGEEFLVFIGAHWPQIKVILLGDAPSSEIQQPRLEVSMTLDLNGAFRAVAKIAFNYLAYREGADYSRRLEFDEVRDYIRGNNLVLPTVPPTGIAVDERFVIQFPHTASPLFSTQGHLVVLFNFDGALCAFVTLYAEHMFLVRLGPKDGQLYPKAHEFSIDGTINHELSLQEIIQRRRAASPEGS
jgi:hypothetical protein